MKVLEKGNKKLTKIVVCAGCGSKLECSPEDFRHWLSTEKAYSYKCPCCGLESYLSENELSTPMKWAIDSKPFNLEIDMDKLDKSLRSLNLT